MGVGSDLRKTIYKQTKEIAVAMGELPCSIEELDRTDASFRPHARAGNRGGRMTFYNHIENVRTMAINLTNGEPWHGARDKARMFDSLDAARREYMQLQEENAKLREQVDAAHMSRLLTENENEKLRELVEDMLDCIDIQIAFERVPARWMQDEFAGRARELGVEVNK